MEWNELEPANQVCEYGATSLINSCDYYMNIKSSSTHATRIQFSIFVFQF